MRCRRGNDVSSNLSRGCNHGQTRLHSLITKARRRCALTFILDGICKITLYKEIDGYINIFFFISHNRVTLILKFMYN